MAKKTETQAQIFESAKALASDATLRAMLEVFTDLQKSSEEDNTWGTAEGYAAERIMCDLRSALEAAERLVGGSR